MKIRFFTTGGTIDKIYFDDKDDFQVGESIIKTILDEAQVSFEFEIQSILKKDSLHMTDADREHVRSSISACPEEFIVVTHGTDTMVQTAKALTTIPGKTIVLTGSLRPARFKESDAEFNIGAAISAVQTMPKGVYITMNGLVFRPDNVRKNLDRNRFETL